MKMPKLRLDPLDRAFFLFAIALLAMLACTYILGFLYGLKYVPTHANQKQVIGQLTGGHQHGKVFDGARRIGK